MKSARLRLAVASCLVLACGALAAQQTTPAPAGRGSLAGTVVDAVTNEPIARATVNVSADGNHTRVSAVTGEDGRFALSDVPAGRLHIYSSAGGYMQGYYGARAPFMQTQYFDLADKENASGLVVQMWKNPSVSGTVTRMTNGVETPIAGITVAASRVEVVGGQVTLVNGSRTSTNSRGVYRIDNLAPREYVVAVLAPTSGMSARSMTGAPTLAPLFYPDTTSSATASIIRLGGGEERAGIDFHVPPLTGSSISGVLLGSRNGQQVGPMHVSLRPADPGRIPNPLDARSASADSEGHFTFNNVLPGQYVIEVIDVPQEFAPAGTSRMTYSTNGGGITMSGLSLAAPGVPQQPLAPPPASSTLWARLPVVVGNGNVDDIQVVLQTGASIRGRVVFDGTSPKPGAEALAATGVLVWSADGEALGSLPASGIGADGRFETVGLPPGQYELMPLMMNPVGWSLDSVTVDGRDATGQVLVLGSHDVANAVITYTDRPTRLSGVVRDAVGNPAPDATVYIFSTDRRRWTNMAPMNGPGREVRPGRTGAYDAQILPGEYFVVAVQQTVSDGWRRVSNLESLVPSARTVKLTSGQGVTLDLVVPRGK